MKAAAEKTNKQNLSMAAANSPGQKRKNVEQSFEFVDNRPQTLMQRKLQELAKKSSHVKQLIGYDEKTRQRIDSLLYRETFHSEEKANESIASPMNYRPNGKQGVLQLSKFSDLENKANQGIEPLTEGEIGEATTEIVKGWISGKDYRDEKGDKVQDHVKKGINYYIEQGNDYGAAPYYISMPSIPKVTQDIKNGVFKMAIAHEFGHYIRSQGKKSEDVTFPGVDTILNGIDWDSLLQIYSYANGDKDAWKEEVRADLKGVEIEYRKSGELPDETKLSAYETMLGGAVDHDHPPANVRVQAMRDYIATIPPPKSCCYLTTACIQAKGLQDDCEELTLLRRFRDNYLLKCPNGPALFDLYYKYSPKILEAIEQSEEKKIIYEYIYEVLRNCVENIKSGNMKYVYNKYCEMVVKLKEHFIPEEVVPTFHV